MKFKVESFRPPTYWIGIKEEEISGGGKNMLGKYVVGEKYVGARAGLCETTPLLWLLDVQKSPPEKL